MLAGTFCCIIYLNLHDSSRNSPACAGVESLLVDLPEGLVLDLGRGGGRSRAAGARHAADGGRVVRIAGHGCCLRDGIMSELRIQNRWSSDASLGEPAEPPKRRVTERRIDDDCSQLHQRRKRMITMRSASVLAGLLRSAAASDVHTDSDILFGFMPDWPRW